MIRVLIVDDHPIFRRGLALSLEEAGDLQICGEGETAAEALALAQELQPDVVLLDLSLPGGGLSVLPAIAALPGLSVAVLTASEAGDDVMQALAAGAAGYIVKGIGSRALIEAIRGLAQGEGYVAPSLAARILTERRREPGAMAFAASPALAGSPARGESPDTARSSLLDQLTRREAEVLDLVAAGCSNKEIGRLVEMQEKTVKHHMTRILHKLNARNRTEAAIVLRTERPPS